MSLKIEIQILTESLFLCIFSFAHSIVNFHLFFCCNSCDFSESGALLVFMFQLRSPFSQAEGAAAGDGDGDGKLMKSVLSTFCPVLAGAFLCFGPFCIGQSCERNLLCPRNVLALLGYALFITGD